MEVELHCKNYLTNTIIANSYFIKKYFNKKKTQYDLSVY